MPRLDTLSWIIWTILICLQIVLAFILDTRARRWSSLLRYMQLKVATSFFLLIVTLALPDTDLRAAIYFYGYWALRAVAHAMEVWVIIQIADRMAGCTAAISRSIRIVLPVLAVLLLVVAIYVAEQTRMASYGLIATGVINLSRAVTLALMMLFLATVLPFDGLGIRWTPDTLGVAQPLALSVCGQAVMSWLLAFFPYGRVSDLNSVIYIAALTLWCLHLRRSPKPEQLPSIERVRAAVQASHDVFERAKVGK